MILLRVVPTVILTGGLRAAKSMQGQKVQEALIDPGQDSLGSQLQDMPGQAGK